MLDMLPAWPAYLPGLFVVGIVMFAVMYAPWEVADRVRAHKNRRGEVAVGDARGAARTHTLSGG
jgi:hypothetical protein